MITRQHKSRQYANIYVDMLYGQILEVSAITKLNELYEYFAEYGNNIYNIIFHIHVIYFTP